MLCSINCGHTKVAKVSRGISVLPRVGILVTLFDIWSANYHIKGHWFYRRCTGGIGEQWKTGLIDTDGNSQWLWAQQSKKYSQISRGLRHILKGRISGFFPELRLLSVGVVCGSELGGLAKTVMPQPRLEVDYTEIPHVPASKCTQNK